MSTSHAAEEVAATGKPRPPFWRSGTALIFLGLILGVVLGGFLPQDQHPTAFAFFQFCSKGFLSLIKGIIVPLLVATIITGIAQTGDLKAVGRMGAKSLLYFEVVTTVALFVGLVVANWLKPGEGLPLKADAHTALAVPKSGWEIALHAFPSNLVKHAADGDILPVVIFATLFGVAPAILLYVWTLHDVRGVGWAVAMLFATCCALRLARFNTELEAPDRPAWTQYFFTGIPAPAAAGLALTPLIASFVIGDAFARSWALNAVFLTFVAGMMVSRVPTFSIKKIRIPPERVLATLLLASVVIVGLVVETWLTLSLIGLAYLLSLPFGIVVARRMRERESAASAASAAEAASADEPATGERVVNLGPRQQRPL